MNKLFFSLLLFVCGVSHAQSVIKLASIPDSIHHRYNNLNGALNFSISIDNVLEKVKRTNQITLPNKTGKPELFTLVISHTLSPELQNQFPSILSFCGQSTSNPSKKIRLDINEKGLFAWVKSSTESYFIHSLEADKNQLILFDEADYKANKSKEYIELEPRRAKETEVTISKSKTRLAQKTNGGTLRKYRMAVSCTGEYAQYH